MTEDKKETNNEEKTKEKWSKEDEEKVNERTEELIKKYQGGIDIDE